MPHQSALRPLGFPWAVPLSPRRNGCEFASLEPINASVVASTCYTRACAAWEKDSVEKGNRIVRRFYPKGADFAKVTGTDIRRQAVPPDGQTDRTYV